MVSLMQLELMLRVRRFFQKFSPNQSALSFRQYYSPSKRYLAHSRFASTQISHPSMNEISPLRIYHIQSGRSLTCKQKMEVISVAIDQLGPRDRASSDLCKCPCNLSLHLRPRGPRRSEDSLRIVHYAEMTPNGQDLRGIVATMARLAQQAHRKGFLVFEIFRAPISHRPESQPYFEAQEPVSRQTHFPKLTLFAKKCIHA
mmetsp:Transcript_12813/g.25723  ORF Transcript_12813/g.25723 Transcript_12813/m.25723 type:complete len:201 (+) Transcript_12813:1426-2028(+)